MDWNVSSVPLHTEKAKPKLQVIPNEIDEFCFANIWQQIVRWIVQILKQIYMNCSEIQINNLHKSLNNKVNIFREGHKNLKKNILIVSDVSKDVKKNWEIPSNFVAFSEYMYKSFEEIFFEIISFFLPN